MPRPAITITLVDRKGTHPCHHGHQIGDSWDFDAERGFLCPMAMHVAFIFADILRYGGAIPGQPSGSAIFACPDVETLNVFRLETVPSDDTGRKMYALRLRCRRAYAPPAVSDGRLVLVDRLWPRGLSKDTIALDHWEKVVAPSRELRQRFGHAADRFADFASAYREELAVNPQAAAFVKWCRDALAVGPVTLLYAAKDATHNNAFVLRQWVLEHL
ncbi:MAG: TIGR04076 family protein [Desulfovibrio sp.]|nr:TIGR04076 family protein [Desulfovibrio sp.]